MVAPYKGAHIAPLAPVEDIIELSKMGADLIRCQIHGNIGDGSYIENVERALKVIESYVEFIRTQKIQLKLVLDLHNMADLPTLKEAWYLISNKFKGTPEVVAYDLLNEPALSTKDNNLWMRELYNTVRCIDKEKRLIISSAYGDPGKFSSVKYIEDPYTWYTAHVYAPLRLTHQGLYEYPAGVKYPTNAFNKQKLNLVLSSLRNFQIKHRARIYIGEFSCSNFTDTQSKYNYIRDCIDLFDQYKWHWSYHAYHEAPVWQPTPDILELLKTSWAK